MFQKEGLRELVEVNIGELGDAEAVKGRGKIGDTDGIFNDVDFVASDLAGIKGKSCGG